MPPVIAAPHSMRPPSDAHESFAPYVAKIDADAFRTAIALPNVCFEQVSSRALCDCDTVVNEIRDISTAYDARKMCALA